MFPSSMCSIRASVTPPITRGDSSPSCSVAGATVVGVVDGDRSDAPSVSSIFLRRFLIPRGWVATVSSSAPPGPADKIERASCRERVS